MGRLFWKVFLWFWLATLLLVSLAAWVTHQVAELAESADTPRPFAAARVAGAVDRIAQALAAGVEGAELERLASRERPIFVLDPQGRDRLGRAVPAPVEALARGDAPDLPSGRRFLAQIARTPDGERLRVVAELPEPSIRKSGRTGRGRRSGAGAQAFFGSSRYRPFWWVRLAVAVLVSGAVCYLLARYLAAPAQRLRFATQRLARGDLSVRIGASMGRRRDEIADLARDFDAMAERMGDLLTARERLLRDVSHELRSPLARLQVALELARGRAEGRAGSEHDRIELEAERLGDLIGQILELEALSRPLTDAAQSLDVGALVGEVVEDAKFEGEPRRQTLRFDLTGEHVVRGEPTQLRSAFENVVRNALRYAPDGSEVVVAVGAAAGGERVEVRVRDAGPGVPAEHLPHLFEPFFRVDDARDRGSGGHGLGLAIAERIVLRHRGQIAAANAPGPGGLVVTIDLPRAPSP